MKTKNNKMKLLRAAMTLLLLLSNSLTALAQYAQGPWTYSGQRSGDCYFWDNTSISYYTLDNSHWGNIYFLHDEWGTGARIWATPPKENKCAIYTNFTHTENVPSYTRMRLNCNYQLSQYNSYTYWQTTALYACDGTETLRSTPLDFTDGWSDQSGKQYLLNKIFQNSPGENVYNFSNSFDFDNRNSSLAQSKTWSLMLTTVTGCHQNPEYLHFWGRFKNTGYTWDYYYYTHVTFDTNGGSGSMSQQTIENSGTLTASTLTREGYVFAGWNTAADGSGTFFADGAAITATADFKGPVKLYAQWISMPQNLS